MKFKNKATILGWRSHIHTASTFPPRGLFTKPAVTIARTMSRIKVSPLGLGSAIKMVQMYINRAGSNLVGKRKTELEKAKQIIQLARRENLTITEAIEKFEDK